MDTTLDPIAEELPVPQVPFDVFSVGTSEPAPALPAASLADPLQSRPGAADGRATKLPAESSPGNGEEGSNGGNGLGGSGGGNSDGTGAGEGSGDGDATGVYTPAPAYPSEARRRNIEGSVLVELAIAADCSCALRRILESSGFSPLDEAVEKTVTHWKYRASEDDGRSDTTTKRIRFTFKLGR
ncbi:MAG: energy transducer TonB [Planctomycetes bacterium]|nr:energy transducer TonB [Planctomycetota bacterium]